MNRVLRALLLTCVVLALALGFLFYHQVPHQQVPFREAETADAFEVTQGTRTVRLVHASSWTVQLGDLMLPTEPVKAAHAISSLASLQVEDQISDRADRSAEFQIDASSGLRVVTYKKGKKVGEGIFGKQAPDFMHIYFAYANKPAVYLAKGVTRTELEPAEPNGWRSHEMTQLAEADIQSVTLAAGARTMMLARSSDSWTLDGKLVDSAKVYVLLGTLAHLRADAFTDPQQRLSTDAATVTVSAAHGATALHIGVADPLSKQVPVTIDNVPGGFLIADDKAKLLLFKPADFPVKKT